MKITITMIYPDKNREYNIQVDNTQRIITTLKVMCENICGLEDVCLHKNVRLENTGRILQIEKSYEENKVFSGAKLIVTHNANENKGEL